MIFNYNLFTNKFLLSIFERVVMIKNTDIRSYSHIISYFYKLMCCDCIVIVEETVIPY